MITTCATTSYRVPLGVVLYDGSSQLDGKPVVAVATGLRNASSNSKTGRMVQTWILRSDIPPVAAIHAGHDGSICGQCPLRGIVDHTGDSSVNRMRSCYVRVEQAPQAVFHAFQRGRYVPFDNRRHAGLFRDLMLRLGSYGDPAAIPFGVWSPLFDVVAGWTAYSHCWRDSRFGRFRRIAMASCETLADATLAQSRGWRTFRTALAGELPARGEFACPASVEQGKRLTCERCGACNGANGSSRRASVLIQAHGSPATQGSYRRMAASL